MACIDDETNGELELTGLGRRDIAGFASIPWRNFGAS
jgi:hypothetical protein